MKLCNFEYVDLLIFIEFMLCNEYRFQLWIYFEYCTMYSNKVWILSARATKNVPRILLFQEIEQMWNEVHTSEYAIIRNLKLHFRVDTEGVES